MSKDDTHRTVFGWLTLCSFVRELNWSMNANAKLATHPEQRWITVIYKVQTSVHVEMTVRIQMANLDPVLVVRTHSKQGHSVHSDNMVQQGYVGKFIRRKGGADENHQK